MGLHGGINKMERPRGVSFNFSGGGDPLCTLFKNSSILPWHALIDYFKLLYNLCAYFNNLLPQSFNSMWTVNAERRPGENVPTLRSHNDLFLPTSRLVSTEKFPLLSFPRIWTNLQEINIKESSSLPHFNCNLKKYFLDKLLSNYTCERLLCPHCHLGT